jgi:chromosome condensin MukBEF ATPase and DNA-binding subunit MukB
LKIQDAQESEAAARATAEARDQEAANLRKQLAEVEGTLSVQQNLEVRLYIQYSRSHKRLAGPLSLTLDPNLP